MTESAPSDVDGGELPQVETKYVDDGGCSRECYLKVCSHIRVTESGCRTSGQEDDGLS